MKMRNSCRVLSQPRSRLLALAWGHSGVSLSRGPPAIIRSIHIATVSGTKITSSRSTRSRLNETRFHAKKTSGKKGAKDSKK